MAEFDYNEARETAKEIIEFFGDPVDLIKLGQAGGYDEYDNPVADEPDTTISGTCSPLLDYDASMMGAYNEADTQIQVGDKYCYYHADSSPELGMQITVNSVLYVVKSIVWLSSLSDVRIYTKLQLRS